VRFLCLTLCLALTAAVAPAQSAQHPSPLLCGDSQALWLVRPSDDGNNFDVLFRPTGEKWQTLVTGISGKVSQVASLGGTLQVIFKDPLGQGMFQMNSPDMVPLERPSNPQWPPGAVPLALCAADKFDAATKPCLIALVSQYGDTSSTSPASAPTSRTSTTGAARNPFVSLQPFLFSDGKWQAMTDVPLDSFTRKNNLAMIAVADGKLYRMVSPPGHEGNSLSVWEHAVSITWPSFWRSIALEEDLAYSKPIAMFTFAGKLAVLAAVPAEKDKIHLALFILESPGPFQQVYDSTRQTNLMRGTPLRRRKPPEWANSSSWSGSRAAS